MSAAEHLREAIAEGCTRDDHDHIAAHRAEVLAEVTKWLVKKSREQDTWDAAVLASKVARGAIRPDNLRMLPATFFTPDHTYTRQHHGETIRFLVEYVSVSPDGRYTVAHGWRTDAYSGWSPFDSDDFEGWTDVTGSGDGA